MSETPTGPLSESVLGKSFAAEVTALVDGVTRERRVPAQIGPYHILELIGEGGMGEVYKAERRQPIRQTVAVKIVKLGFDSREVVGRFESERQTLALMDHPGIAKVLNAGTTEAGRPFFVMEYVAGTPITHFCDENRLSITDRLTLFMTVCAAIAHAHGKAIIHRDIKPSNVLAFMHDRKPAAKVIDFGIAKALSGDRMTDQTFFTARGQAIGTYDSMSPEQADGSPDIDTRTDVYALGVLLYELLTGVKPFDHRTLAKAAHAEIRRIIREVEPPRPSTRLSTLGIDATKFAEQRQAKLDVLAKQLRSELEWIPLKAMRKDRTRRYASALQLQEDVQNYLNGKPLLAGPETRAYRVQKFINRNRAAAVTSATVLAALAIGISLYVHNIRAEQRRTQSALVQVEQQKRVADQQREDALAAAASAKATVSFFTDALETIDPYKLRGQGITVAQATEAVVKDLDAGKLNGQVPVEAAVRVSIGQTFRALGLYQQSSAQLRRALELHRQSFPGDHPFVAGDLAALAVALANEGGKLDQAESLARDALAMIKRLRPADDPQVVDAMDGLATILQDQGKFAECEQLIRDAIAIDREARPLESDARARLLSTLALPLVSQNRLSEAEAAYIEALSIHRAGHPQTHPLIANDLNRLGHVLEREGKFAEAENLLREALQIRRATLPEGHPEIAEGLANIGRVLSERGKYAEASAPLRDALEMLRKSLPPTHIELARVINNYSQVLLMQGKDAKAEPLVRESLQILRQTLPAGHTSIGMAMSQVGAVLHEEGKEDEAESFYRGALEIQRKALPAGHPEVIRAMSSLAAVLCAQRKYDQAEPLMREAIELWRAKLPESRAALAASLNNLASLLQAREKLDDAESASRQALAAYREAFSSGTRDLATPLMNLGGLLNLRGKFTEAEPLLREAVEICTKTLPTDHPDRATALNGLAFSLYHQGRLIEAEPMYREVLEIRRNKYGPTAKPTTQTAGRLADLLDKAARPDQAAGVREEFHLAGAVTRAATTGPSAAQPDTNPSR